MKIETKTVPAVRESLKAWSSVQVADMIARGYVCAKCTDGLLILGHVDRIHCSAEGRAVDARRKCGAKD